MYCYREYGNHQFLTWLAIYYFISHVFPAIIGHLCSVCAVLDQRRRRCTAPTLGQRCIGAVHMFCVWHDALERWCFSAGPTSATLAQYWSTIVSTCRVCWVTGLWCALHAFGWTEHDFMYVPLQLYHYDLFILMWSLFLRVLFLEVLFHMVMWRGVPHTYQVCVWSLSLCRCVGVRSK